MADEYIVKSNGHYSPLLTHMMNKRKEAPQPQREWVGLTDTERAAVQFEAFKRGLTPIEFMELHEDKLKEKNYGLR